MTCGPLPMRTREASSAKVTSDRAVADDRTTWPLHDRLDGQVVAPRSGQVLQRHSERIADVGVNLLELMAALRNLVVGVLSRAGPLNVAAALRRHARDPHRPLATLGISLG
jgi:hypothetical protein